MVLEIGIIRRSRKNYPEKGKVTVFRLRNEPTQMKSIVLEAAVFINGLSRRVGVKLALA